MLLKRDRAVERRDIFHFWTKLNTSKITRHDKSFNEKAENNKPVFINVEEKQHIN